MRDHYAYGRGSAGEMRATSLGEGSSTRTVIRLTSGQWDGATVRKIENGIEITVVGEFEFSELATFLKRIDDGDTGPGWVDFVEVAREDMHDTQIPF